MKRGESGLSLVCGVNKPLGMSSHDVVNQCRRIFGEKRVGHAGTLDPDASGALLICVGPATRLSTYMTLQDKRYRFKVSFGAATDTDDAAGEVIETGAIPEEVYDPFFAQGFVERLVGLHSQVPPAYSAIKVKGERSYKAARQGKTVELAARPIKIREACLLGVEEGNLEELPSWKIEVYVSKGTYIRSLARDIGAALSCPAHVSELERIQTGALHLEDCYTLDALSELGKLAALDPIVLLGYRCLFVPDDQVSSVKNGSSLQAEDYVLYFYPFQDNEQRFSSCSPAILKSTEELSEGELISVIAENTLVGIYKYDKNAKLLKPQCIFSVGVLRGNDL